MNRDIDLLTCPLSGTNLIEANAGTGKTYTITALTARMICEQTFTVDKILVVTFTKAAVSDLKAKIYERLNLLRDGFRAAQAGTALPDDEFIKDYVTQNSGNAEKALRLLNNAIKDFDTASIFTIHSFCQRMLTENSFSGRIAYDTEMTGDAADILIDPVRDFWRRYIYALPADAAKLFSDKTPENLTDFLMKLEANPSAKLINTPDTDLEDFLNASDGLSHVFDKVKEIPDSVFDEVFSLIFPQGGQSPMNGRSYTTDGIRKAFRTIKDQILLGDRAFRSKVTPIRNLTAENISTKNKAKFTPPEHPFFHMMSEWQSASDNFDKYKKNFVSAMLIRLKEYTDDVLDAHRMRVNSQSYNDLITRMHSAVSAGDSRMAEHIHNKFMAVLIDEFQDTDPMQYDIFTDSFGRYGMPVFMIGDPKQAIYSFRGADVYTYLKASSDKTPLTLTRNHRSDKDLVRAVNGVFSGVNAFGNEKIKYNESQGELEITVTLGTERVSPMTVWHADQANKEMLAEACAAEIARLLNGRAEITDKKGKRTARPSDIAVLARTKDQAIAVRNSLSALHVPCVISGSENVFASQQARDMARLLSAAVSPYSERAVRTALITDIFGYTAEQLYSLDETDGWEDVFSKFLELSDILNRAGVAPMFFRAAKIASLYERLAAQEQGERRLTNLIHLTELLQKREAEKKASPAQLVIWLTEQISLSSKRNEQYELKMDSDENAVTITTIHKSKGLEYDIVFTPFIMLSRKNNKDEITGYHDESDELVLDMSGSDEAAQKQKEEGLEEDLRLIYVALTRARAVCCTAWGTVSKGTTQSQAMLRLVHGESGKYDCMEANNFFGKIDGVTVTDLPVESGQIYVSDDENLTAQNMPFSGRVPAPWRINSFSGLVHSASSVRDTDQYTQAETEAADTFSIFAFPKGAKAGSCLHECMEDTPLDGFTEETVRKTVEEKLNEYFFDERYVPAVTENIINILTRELIQGVRLGGISSDEHVHEMEFHMSTREFTSGALADIFAQNGQEDFARACSRLDFTAVEGFMTGFADLIFRKDEKFYIVDWKSNHLGGRRENYSQENLHAEMIRSHYYLQLYFYTMALHMYLTAKMDGYDYDTHMGGGIYVFMRGVGADGDEGLYCHRPDKQTIVMMTEAANEHRG